MLKKINNLVVILVLAFIGCKGDDPAGPDPDTDNKTVNYSTISTDPTGDADNGLDGRKIEFKYDPVADSIHFRITVADLEPFESSPSVDLSFRLPNGTVPSSTLSSPFRGETKTHRTVSVYTDKNGSSPTNYTYLFGTYAANGIAFTSKVASSSSGKDLEGICADCVDLYVDVPKNQITISMDRKKIISNQEIGSTKSAVVKLVANTGYQMGNNDLVADGVDFTINFN
jgi:hypothetical protein